MKVAVVGAGGHGRELASIARAQHGSSIESLVFLDDNLEPGDYAFGSVIGGIESTRGADLTHVIVGIGDPGVRAQVANRFELESLKPLTCIHPLASVGERCTLGDGVVIGPNSALTCDVVVGAHTHIHAGVTIAHDCTIGEFAVVTPGVSIAGDVVVQDLAWIGVGATINRGVLVRRGAVVGAGAVVIDEVAQDDTVAGVPARSLSARSQR